MASEKDIVLYQYSNTKLLVSDISDDVGLQVYDNSQGFWPEFAHWLAQKRTYPDSAPDWQSATAPFTEKIPTYPEVFDYILGCQILDLDFVSGNGPLRRIWVRAEYIRTFEAIEKHERMERVMPNAFILAGQPGTGG